MPDVTQACGVVISVICSQILRRKNFLSVDLCDGLLTVKNFAKSRTEIERCPILSSGGSHNLFFSLKYSRIFQAHIAQRQSERVVASSDLRAFASLSWPIDDRACVLPEQWSTQCCDTGRGLELVRRVKGNRR